MQTILLKTTFKHRGWRVIPNKSHPNSFTLENAETGKVLGSFVLPKDGDPKLINLIASAPELQDIAEMYRDYMIGSKAENTMVYAMVKQVLERIAPLECA